MTQPSAPPPASLTDEVARVLNAGLCVGCGACALKAPQAITMQRDRDGIMQARIATPSTAPGGICPFSGTGPDEDALGAAVFGTDIPADPRLGRARRSYAGFVAEKDFRAQGSSGGMATWLTLEALRTGMVDAVVHVHPAKGDALFEFAVARSAEDIRAGAKSRYYSVSFETALREALATSDKIAFVGVPCFIKALRRLAATDPVIGQKITLTLAIICGHMKGPGFAESLAWQVGVAPGDIAAVDFRVKRPAPSAKLYGFSATSKTTGETHMKPMGALAGRRWDGGHFRLKACDFCDDVTGETADVSCGDAWLPRYDTDPAGTNVIVVRDARVEALIEAARTAGRLSLDDIDADTAAASQSGGFRDRREGLAYRLWRADRAGQWYPPKRVAPGARHLGLLRRGILRLRQIVQRRSFASLRGCKARGSILAYRVEMTLWHKVLALLTLADQKISTHLPPPRP